MKCALCDREIPDYEALVNEYELHSGGVKVGPGAIPVHEDCLEKELNK